MEVFNLPPTAKVNRVVPKNAFDSYTNAKQKKQFTDSVQRITWLYKLSPNTINLEAKEITEIQIFKIELKIRESIDGLLAIIDKAIPYPIIFVVEIDSNIYLSTSIKHPHPINEDNAVIDWTFQSEWFQADEVKYWLRLKNSLDAVYNDFCLQLFGSSEIGKKSIQELVTHSKLVDSLNKDVNRLQSSITKCKQFNQKVELNLQLQSKKKELSQIERKFKGA